MSKVSIMIILSCILIFGCKPHNKNNDTFLKDDLVEIEEKKTESGNEIESTVSSSTFVENDNIQDDSDDSVNNWDWGDVKAAYSVIEFVYKNTYTDSKIFDLSVRFINNAVKEAISQSYYKYKDRVINLYGAFQWLEIAITDSFDIIVDGLYFPYSGNIDEWENIYEIADIIYGSISGPSKIFRSSTEFINNFIKDILIHYGEHGTRIDTLFNRLEVEKKESLDKYFSGYTFFINTGGTFNEFNTVLFYKKGNEYVVYGFDEIAPGLLAACELFGIYHLANNMYLLGFGTSMGGGVVGGGYLCVEVLHGTNGTNIVPRNIFNEDAELTYTVYIHDYRDFSFSEENKTIDIKLGDEHLQLHYENGIFIGDYIKLETMIVR